MLRELVLVLHDSSLVVLGAEDGERILKVLNLANNGSPEDSLVDLVEGGNHGWRGGTQFPDCDVANHVLIMRDLLGDPLLHLSQQDLDLLESIKTAATDQILLFDILTMRESGLAECCGLSVVCVITVYVSILACRTTDKTTGADGRVVVEQLVQGRVDELGAVLSLELFGRDEVFEQAKLSDLFGERIQEGWIVVDFRDDNLSLRLIFRLVIGCLLTTRGFLRLTMFSAHGVLHTSTRNARSLAGARFDNADRTRGATSLAFVATDGLRGVTSLSSFDNTDRTRGTPGLLHWRG